jgi:NAD-dependent dihydropyrimidine dehydrogenase PreA subunit
MTYVIAQPCVDVKDKGCVAACPVDCIYEGPRSMYIHPEECIDCGACEPACPTQAIYYEEDVPSRWRFFHQANVEFFDGLGSPKGAKAFGVSPTDHPLIAALPPLGVVS